MLVHQRVNTLFHLGEVWVEFNLFPLLRSSRAESGFEWSWSLPRIWTRGGTCSIQGKLQQANQYISMSWFRPCKLELSTQMGSFMGSLGHGFMNGIVVSERLSYFCVKRGQNDHGPWSNKQEWCQCTRQLEFSQFIIALHVWISPGSKNKWFVLVSFCQFPAQFYPSQRCLEISRGTCYHPQIAPQIAGCLGWAPIDWSDSPGLPSVRPALVPALHEPLPSPWWLFRDQKLDPGDDRQCIYIYVWYDIIWYDMIWYGMIWYDIRVYMYVLYIYIIHMFTYFWILYITNIILQITYYTLHITYGTWYITY